MEQQAPLTNRLTPWNATHIIPARKSTDEADNGESFAKEN